MRLGNSRATGEEPSSKAPSSQKPSTQSTPTRALNSKRLASKEPWKNKPTVNALVPNGTQEHGCPTASFVLTRILPPVALVVVLLFAWEAYTYLSGISPRVLPAPSRVLEQAWDHRQVLGEQTMSTIEVTVLGFAVSLVVSWLLAVLVSFSLTAQRTLVPLFVLSQAIPMIAIAPLVILWFGFGFTPKVFVVVLATFFPVTIGLIEGFAAVDSDALRLVRSMGASRWQVFCYVRLPSALPRFFTSLRIGITYAVVGAIFAEYVGAMSGLGIYMRAQQNSFRTDLVLAAVAITAMVSIGLFFMTYLIERLVIPWAKDMP